MKKIISLTPLIALLFTTPALCVEVPKAWITSVANLIAKYQTYPRSAQIRGEEGTTQLRISLAADGTVNQVELAASSGSAILDRQAQSVVTSIGKFPAPPAGFNKLSVPIVWRLN